MDFAFNPQQGLTLGPLLFAPITPGDLALISLNAFRGEFFLHFPPATIQPVIPGFWSGPALNIFDEGFTIDTTADFEFRLPLPSTVSGFSMEPGPLSRNHLLIERKNRQIGFRVRNEQDLLFGTMILRLNATSQEVNGALSGQAVLPGFIPVPLGAATLSYERTAPFPFEGRFAFPTGPFALQFAPFNARICTLDCPAANLEDCSTGPCFP